LFNLITLIIITASVFFNGFVFMKLWEWFPAEIFNLPTLSYVSALGISFFISYAFRVRELGKEKEEKTEEENFAYSLAIAGYLGATLGVGAIIHAFM
jgi:hypothetical protein